jgi:hypothetical protein
LGKRLLKSKVHRLLHSHRMSLCAYLRHTFETDVHVTQHVHNCRDIIRIRLCLFDALGTSNTLYRARWPVQGPPAGLRVCLGTRDSDFGSKSESGGG